MKGRTVSGLWKGPEQGKKVVDQTWPAKAGLEELRGARRGTALGETAVNHSTVEGLKGAI